MKLDPNLQFVWKELLTDRGRKLAIYTLLLVVAVEVLALIAPYGLGQIVAGISQQDRSLIINGLILYALFGGVSHLMHHWLFQVREWSFQENIWSIPQRLAELFFGLTLGQLINRNEAIDGGGVESLREKIWDLIGRYLFSIIPSSASIFFGVIICFFINPVVGVGVSLFILVDRWWSNRFNLRLVELVKPIEVGYRRWHRRMRERWEAVALVKWNGVEERVVTETTKEIQPTIKLDDAVWRVHYARHISGRRALSLLVVLSIAGWLGQQSLTVGVDTASFIWLLMIVQQIVQRLREIADAEQEVQRNQARVTNYREDLTQPPEFRHNVGKYFTAKTIGVSMQNISLWLGENGDDREILRDVSFTISPGERVAIVGPSGAGKSQLVNLMLRAYDPTAGTVNINGTDIRELSLESLSRRVGFIPQDMTVFEGTIRENVGFGLSHLDHPSNRLNNDNALWRVIEMAGLDFGERLSEGLETKVGFKGMKLSGGQRQRLTIATALFKEPLLVVADEATSSLDSIAEAHVLEQLYTTLPRSTTLVMIAHRLSTLVGCEKIIFVEPLAECEKVSNVRVYTCFNSLYSAEPTFRAMADAQGFCLPSKKLMGERDSVLV